MRGAVIAILFGVLCPLGLKAEDHVLAERVSIIQLIANPERYHGKIVLLGAYTTIDVENASLCMTPNPGSHKDCIWLEYGDNSAQAAWAKLSGHRVTVRGTFNKDNTGHFGGWSGALERVTEYYPD